MFSKNVCVSHQLLILSEILILTKLHIFYTRNSNGDKIEEGTSGYTSTCQSWGCCKKKQQGLRYLAVMSRKDRQDIWYCP